MTSYLVTVTDHRGRILRQFESVGGHRQAVAAGNMAADAEPNARNVSVKPL